MYCKRCRYNLKGSKSSSCPECGRLYDESDPSTYSMHQRLCSTRHYLAGIASIVLLYFLSFFFVFEVFQGSMAGPASAAVYIYGSSNSNVSNMILKWAYYPVIYPLEELGLVEYIDDSSYLEHGRSVAWYLMHVP